MPSRSPRLAVAPLLGALLAAPAVVAAQAAPAVPLDQIGRAFTPGRLTYRVRGVNGAQTVELGTRSIALSRSGPGWLIVMTEQNPRAASLDSLVVGPNLSAVRRAVHARTEQGPATLALAFGDTIVGTMTPPRGTAQTIRVPNPRQAVSSDALIILALGKAPLTANWRGTISLLNLGNGTAVPIEFRVLRSEQISVPAGRFDAWVVESTAGPARSTFWVAKGGPVVRTSAVSVQQPTARFEAELASR